jgi:hypothetical protein
VKASDVDRVDVPAFGNRPASRRLASRPGRRIVNLERWRLGRFSSVRRDNKQGRRSRLRESTTSSLLQARPRAKRGALAADRNDGIGWTCSDEGKCVMRSLKVVDLIVLRGIRDAINGKGYAIRALSRDLCPPTATPDAHTRGGHCPDQLADKQRTLSSS